MGRRTTRPAAVALTLAVTASVLVAVAAFVVTVAVRHDPGSRPEVAKQDGRAMPEVSVTDAVASLAVLRDWDAARAAAWARGDLGALRRLYLPGSAAGRRDLAMLRRWTDRGLVVRRMAVQVHAVELIARSDRRIVLLVTDRLARAVAVGGGERWTLPRDGLTTRRLEFRRTAGRWRLAAAYARPLATTAATSGSANS